MQDSRCGLRPDVGSGEKVTTSPRSAYEFVLQWDSGWGPPRVTISPGLDTGETLTRLRHEPGYEEIMVAKATTNGCDDYLAILNAKAWGAPHGEGSQNGSMARSCGTLLPLHMGIAVEE